MQNSSIFSPSIVLGAMALVAITLFGAKSSIAHENATGVVAERMTAMEAVGDAMKHLTAAFRGQVPYDAETVGRAAGIIAGHGGHHLTRLFPEDSLDDPTEALPTIWQDWDRFETLAGDLSIVADALAAAADNPQPEAGRTGLGMGMPDAGSAMMGGKIPMMNGQNPMMGGPGAAMSPEALARMPPQAAFMQLSQVCNTCHTRFRQER